MTNHNSKKRRRPLKTKKSKKKPPALRPQNANPAQDDDPVLFGGTTDEDRPSAAPNSEVIQDLLELCTKEQLIGFHVDAAATDSDLPACIRAAADRDVSHRKVFVHGLGWDATRDALLEAFGTYGPVEDCNVVIDRATGCAKGYGFVLFRTRAGAVKALKQPQKRIRNRPVFCQFAAVGPASTGDTAGRKVYVSNVPANATLDKLRSFFSRFGEIEAVPSGFDMLTGKWKGYAIFLYKKLEGARKALEEPYKVFEGHRLHCQPAAEPSQRGKAPAPSTNTASSVALLGPALQPVLAAVAATQNLMLYRQNPAYAALLGRNPLLAAAALDPAAAAALNPAAGAGLLSPPGQGLRGGGWQAELLRSLGRIVTNGRRAPATTPFNEPFVAHTHMYSCLTACFLMVLGHFAVNM
ncbi:UBP1-associated protein 2B-like [Musa acuminata AAA Group]|uniref:UBP1-associated protein 2B-like n=1 Tax=Musa acuminata AAA Group TaxID=214697 RepID=UPI0031D11269